MRADNIVLLMASLAIVGCTSRNLNTSADISSNCSLLPGPLPTPWWVAKPPSSCASQLAHAPSQYYDDCTLSGQTWAPQDCRALIPGGVDCAGNFWGSPRLTTVCLKDSDCPTSMACVEGGTPGDQTLSAPGYCEKKCATNADCVRCDLGCNENKVCVPAPPPPTVPCTSDCECSQLPGHNGSGSVCSRGWCIDANGQLAIGYCGGGPGQYAIPCACKGGVCDDRHCCVLPDGSIAGPASPACTN